MNSSLHFVTNPDRSAPADPRTSGLTGLNTLVSDHFRAALTGLNAEAPDLGRVSVRLYYAIESATMAYGLVHPVTTALRDFRTAVDVQSQAVETQWFALDLLLTDCLTALRKATTRSSVKSRLGLAA